jgi:putative transposase
MNLDNHADGLKSLIRDRDATFTVAFDTVFTAVGVRIIQAPVQAPRANAIAERWIRSARRECPDRMLITGEWHLRLVLGEHTDQLQHPPAAPELRRNPPAGRAHPTPEVTSMPVLRRDRLGGLIHEYARSHRVTQFSAPTR